MLKGMPLCTSPIIFLEQIPTSGIPKSMLKAFLKPFTHNYVMFSNLLKLQRRLQIILPTAMDENALFFTPFAIELD